MAKLYVMSRIGRSPALNVSRKKDDAFIGQLWVREDEKLVFRSTDVAELTPDELIAVAVEMLKRKG